MKRVLIIHYHFLPVHNVSTSRLLGYARLLPGHGWTVEVLTRAWRALDEADPSWGLGWEPHLEAGSDCTVHRLDAPPAAGRAGAPGGEARRPHLTGKLAAKAARLWAMAPGHYPDAFVGWARPAVEAGTRIVRERGIDVVMSYCPPETNHLVASRLARRLGVPWVPFFGDLYGFLDPPLPRLSLEGSAKRAWHRRCLAPAAACIAVSPAMVDHLARTYGKPAHLVHTGFDPQEAEEAAPQAPGGRLLLSHVGSVYPGDQRPEIFFDGLDRLLAKRPQLEARLRVRFVGSKCDERLRAMLAGRPAARVCSVEPKLDAAAALALVRESDALLAFTCTAHRDRHGTLSYPTKVFEAFGARRPVLAVPSDGDFVDALLARTGAGTSARDADAVAATLLGWLDAFERDGRVPWGGRDEALAELTRESQVERLAAILDAVSG